MQLCVVATLSQRKCVRASMTSVEVRRALCQGEAYTQMVKKRERGSLLEGTRQSNCIITKETRRTRKKVKKGKIEEGAIHSKRTEKVDRRDGPYLGYVNSAQHQTHQKQFYLAERGLPPGRRTPVRPRSSELGPRSAVKCGGCTLSWNKFEERHIKTLNDDLL